MELMDPKEKLQLSFKLFDHDKDGRLSTNDIMACMKYLKDTDVILMDDLNRILKAINLKRNKDVFSRNQSKSLGISNTGPKIPRKHSKCVLE